MAALSGVVTADLHAHTTASDGDATPGQLVAFAVKAGVKWVAVTDHDTTAGVAEAQAAVQQYASGRVCVVPGVEVSAEFEGQEVHILGLFVRPDDPDLAMMLDKVVAGRRERFRAFVRAIPELAAAADIGLAAVVEAGTASPGRRHIANLLVRTGTAVNRSDAFRRFLIPTNKAVPPKPLVPVAEAIERIRAAGGIASLAHPRPDVNEAYLARLRAVGLQAVEARFPSAAEGFAQELRAIARRLGLAVTGGSDFHGNDMPGRTVGCRGLHSAEWAALRELAQV
jgi:predicted metal-dependent phosphoesterase TrpH